MLHFEKQRQTIIVDVLILGPCINLEEQILELKQPFWAVVETRLSAQLPWNSRLVSKPRCEALQVNHRNLGSFALAGSWQKENVKPQLRRTPWRACLHHALLSCGCSVCHACYGLPGKVCTLLACLMSSLNVLEVRLPREALIARPSSSDRWNCSTSATCFSMSAIS